MDEVTLAGEEMPPLPPNARAFGRFELRSGSSESVEAIAARGEIVSLLNSKIDRLKQLGARIRFDMDGGRIIVDARGATEIRADSTEKADCVVVSSSKYILEIITGKRDARRAAMTGKIKPTGDTGVGLKFLSLVVES